MALGQIPWEDDPANLADDEAVGCLDQVSLMPFWTALTPEPAWSWRRPAQWCSQSS